MSTPGARPATRAGETLDPVDRAVADLVAGRPVVVVDDADRENEGDLVAAAETITTETVAFMMAQCRGLICVPMAGEDLDRLRLPQMVPDNTDSMGTAFTVSVDATAAHGVTTGISAADRAATIRLLADPGASPGDFTRPGHVFPLRARDGGVRERPGHTEAGVELARLAGLRPAAAIVEIAGEDGVMLRLPQLIPFARRHGLTVISIEDLALALAAAPADPATTADPAPGAGPAETGTSPGTAPPGTAPPGTAATGTRPLPGAVPGPPAHTGATAAVPLLREGETALPTSHGDLRAYGYRAADGVEHIAVVAGEIGDGEDVLVRVHSECLTGDVLGSLRCDCGPQLRDALDRIRDEGRGVLVYLRGHEGRGIGLTAKLRAYQLQERGRDTLDANLELGLPADARDYSAAAAILAELGVRSLRLLTNNPGKSDALGDHGLRVLARVHSTAGAGRHNLRYLRAKRDRMGHDLPWLDAPAGAAGH
ncbi:GTP cyclohydrolase II [Streptomyces spiramenti]|uniref:Multifunctional fusion protein n=1 Tax=Streptomyces spiramenti TaxID=2720606 RepID=A0ABX1AKX6_9ACTN|nr:GTP cyclohydrolase II [Streptomyces spiramenti]NJP67779.1 GTP cyclohydrolase II [Streptomyces spiramenti]